MAVTGFQISISTITASFNRYLASGSGHLITMKYLIPLLLFFPLIINAQAQPGKNPGDFFIIKAPPIQYSTPDMNNVLFEDNIVDSSRFFHTDAEFELDIFEDEESVLWEDTTEGELSVVEIDEQMRIDSTWITIASYYAIWDSRTINPYKINGADYNDTLAMALYDSTMGLFWSMPLSKSIRNSPFGYRRYQWHYGTDLDLTTGDPVVACFDGIVRIQQYNARGYGYYVVIRHYNGLETLYGHLSKPMVKVGQLVKAGEIIGLGGSTGRSTGPHLHFEVRYEGNPIDPEFIYDFAHERLRDRIFYLMPEHFGYLKEARQVVYHTVRSGDSIGSISKKYRVSVSTICRLNGISTKTLLRVGRRIRIR